MWTGNKAGCDSGIDPAQLMQLQQQLAAREQEVAALREIAEAAAELQSTDVSQQKVLELSKKNRALNLSLEKERQKVAKLQQALSQASQAQQPAKSQDSRPVAAPDEHLQELSTLKERVAQMTNRMGQMEQKVFLLEGENKKLTRALLREVGEGTPLQKILEEGSGNDWKGRREQIIRLQDTIRQLRDAAGTETAATAAGSSLAKHETAHRNVIGKLNKQKESQLQRMAAELKAVKAETDKLRLKFTGASSRRKVLEEEVAGLRDKLAVCLSKTQNDDKLIAALRKELVAATGGKAGAGRSDSSSFEVSQQRCSELEEQVEQQQKVIRYLQAQLESSKGAAPHQHLQAEVQQLKQQLAVLQLGAGAGGAASALQQQVLLLQEENEQMREQLGLAPQGPRSHLQLTRSDIEVLEAAKEAVTTEPVEGEELEGEGGDEEEEEEGEEEAEGQEEGTE